MEEELSGGGGFAAPGEDGKKVSKTVKSYKITPDLKDEVKSLFLESETKNEDEWFEKVIHIYKLHLLKERNPGYGKLLEYLESHLQGISETFMQMMDIEAEEKRRLIEQHEVDETDLRVTLQDNKIKLQDKTKEAEEMQLKVKAKDEDLQQKTALIKQMEESSQNAKLLVEEYRGKNDTLAGLVKKQQESAEAGEKIRSDYESLQRKYADLEREMASLTERHARELERISEKKDIEREREIIKLRTEYQEDNEKLRRELSGKLVGLYEELHARNRSSGAGLEEGKPPAEPEA